ncbi:hypothetical protein [Halorhabdus amylolytica]|uniref:hypothetical protein n=1 Tax=Halorhabdus amylolytica TaxID=2559573 RepID=UPI0010AB29EF|nr:hypothetical protein [Halorhabdus amylolytica]
MDRLASCYFCGVAVEAPLEEYPVVPRDLRPSVEDQSTVVLCPECRRKLSTIVERVVSATRDPAQTELRESVEATDEEGDRADDSGPGLTGSVERFDDERPNLVDFETGHERDEEMIAREAAHAPDAERADTEEIETDTSETDEGTHVNEGDEGVDANGANERVDANEGTGTSGMDASEANEAAGTSGMDAGEANEAAGTSGMDASEAGTSGMDASEAGTSVDTSDRGVNESDEDGGSNAAADRDFSKSSYNKVVRLLQNREFPVEEEEITTVAGSAYGIGAREAGEVIDALVERGVLERDGSRIRRSDD